VLELIIIIEYFPKLHKLSSAAVQVIVAFQ